MHAARRCRPWRTPASTPLYFTMCALSAPAAPKMLVSASPTELSSPGRNDHRPDLASTGQRFRFGVAFRLLIAFAAITAFAAAISAVALYTFDKYGEGFNRIASSSLPALVAASNLAQRSQALAANAPNLAGADGHFTRRAISEALGSQL